MSTESAAAATKRPPMKAKRDSRALERLEEGKAALVQGVPLYESREGGGAAPMHPGDFLEEHRTRADWDRADRRLKPGAVPCAYLASWWHGSRRNPTQWVAVYALSDTLEIKRRGPRA